MTDESRDRDTAELRDDRAGDPELTAPMQVSTFNGQILEVDAGSFGSTVVPAGPLPGAEPETGSTRGNMRRLGRSSVLAAAITMLSQLLLTPFIVRIANLEIYGTFAVISTYLAFGAFLDFGLRAELTRRVAAARGVADWSGMAREINDATSILGLVGLLVLALGAGLSPVIARFAVPTAGASGLLVALVAITAVGFVFDGRVAALNGLQRGDVLQYAGIVSVLLRTSSTVLLLALSQSVWSLFAAQAISTAAVWIIVNVRLRQIAPNLRLRLVPPRWSVARGLWSGTALLALSQVSDLVDYNVDRLLISHYSGVREAAQFTIGAQLPISFRSLALIPTGVLLAGVAQFTASSDYRRADALLDGVTRLVVGMGVIMLIGTLAIAPSFYDVYLGRGFHLTSVAAQLLSVATFLNLCSAGWGLYAVAHGWYRVVGWAAGANVAVNGTVSFALIVRIGYIGGPLGSIIGTVVGLVTLYIGVRAKERRAWLRPLSRPLMVAAILSIPAVLYAAGRPPLPWLTLAIGVPSVIGICAGSLLMTKSLTPSLVRSLLLRGDKA